MLSVLQAKQPGRMGSTGEDVADKERGRNEGQRAAPILALFSPVFGPRWGLSGRPPLVGEKQAPCGRVGKHPYPAHVH